MQRREMIFKRERNVFMEQLKNFIVVNVADNILKDQDFRRSKYDVTIQTGCALTDRRIAELSDDVGDNISALNPSYSELTALYWVWKHQKAEYIGWRHYRRFLAIRDEELEQCMADGIDVIMPQPITVKHNVQQQYIGSTTLDTWDAMMRTLQKLEPDYYLAATDIFSKNSFFPFCMGIWSWAYFDAYCSWLFPILDEVYRIIGPKWDVYKNRYIAFLAERLHSLYFMVNCDAIKYKLVQVKVFNSIDSSVEHDDELTEEQGLSMLEGLLKNRQVYKASGVAEEILSKNKDKQWKNLELVSKILIVARVESVYTEMTLCRYSDSWKELCHHYNVLVNYLKPLEDDISAFLENEFFNYLYETSTSMYAISNIAALEMKNTVKVLLELAKICMKRQQQEEAAYYLRKIQEL